LEDAVTRSTLFTLAAAGLVSTAACAGSDTKAATDSSAASSAPSASSSSGVDLTGAGATFPYPIYSKWISDYRAKTGVKINYQAIGSGGGIRQLQEGTVDFGASDAPMTDEELAKAKGPVLHIPTVLGAVVLTYNVPGLTQPLNLRLLGLRCCDSVAGNNPGYDDIDKSIAVFIIQPSTITGTNCAPAVSYLFLETFQHLRQTVGCGWGGHGFPIVFMGDHFGIPSRRARMTALIIWVSSRLPSR
jgi:hypothetical protein